MSRRFKYTLLAPLFIIATLVLQFSNIPLVHAATRTWDGSAGDGKFSTAANWSSDTVPVTGDVIAFTPLAGGTDGQAIFLDNDLTGVNLAGVVSTKSSSDNSKTFYINKISFAADATISQTGSGTKTGSVGFAKSSDVGNSNTSELTAAGNLTVNSGLGLSVGQVTIGGNLAVDDYFYNKGGSISGNFTAKSGQLENTTVNGTITLASGNTGLGIKAVTSTIPTNFVIGAKDASVDNQLAFASCATEAMGGASSSVVTVACGTYADATFTLSGNITLNADLIIHVGSKSIVKLTGTITTNGHSITKQSTSLGTLEVGGSAVTNPDVTTQLDGDQASTDASIANQETGYLNGSRGLVTVAPGGTLKGTGTANSVSNSGTVAPGNSPGKLTVLNNYSQNSGATYQPEILNVDTYDQLAVGASYSGGGNAVILAGTLDTVLYDGWSVQTGDEFMIIDNQSSTAVSGTFAGLSEGSQFTVSNEGVDVTFSITYVGGDGNDVVITALNDGEDPTPPNTGAAKLVLGNPILLAGLGVVTAGLLTFIAIRRRAAK